MVASLPDSSAKYVETDAGRPTKDFYNWLKQLSDSMITSVGAGLSLSGNVLTTQAIAFAAHKNGTNQTGLVHFSYNTLTWPAKKFGTQFDTATGRWTPGVAGYVQLNCSVWITSGNTANSPQPPVVKIFKNGSADVAAGVGTPVAGPTAAGEGIAHVSCVDSCSATDYYQAEIFYVSALAINDGVVDGNMAHTHFSGHWIGA